MVDEWRELEDGVAEGVATIGMPPDGSAAAGVDLTEFRPPTGRPRSADRTRARDAPMPAGISPGRHLMARYASAQAGYLPQSLAHCDW